MRPRCGVLKIFCILQLFPPVTLYKEKTFTTQMIDWGYTRFCLTDEGEVILYGRTQPDSLPVIHKYSGDGELLQTWQPPRCRHAPAPDHIGSYNSFRTLSIQGALYLAEACFRCQSIDVHKTSSDATEGDAWINAFTVADGELHSFSYICAGKSPADTVLAVSPRGHDACEVIVYDCSSTTFTVKDIIPIDNMRVKFFTFLESGYPGGLIICSDWNQNLICATSLADKQLIWRLHGEVMGKSIRPNGMCTNDRGRLYVADGSNGRILVSDGSTGHLLQVIELSDLGCIVHVAWCNTQPNLIVRHRLGNGNDSISYYNVTWITCQGQPP